MTSFSAVVTTGIYCRPGCGAKPRAENVRTFDLPAAAEAKGFRACLRCRPYRMANPVRSDPPELVCRAVQLIIAGALDVGTEAALGVRLGVSPRHLRRLFREHLGITPDQLARSRRAHFARRMLDDTDLTVADVAFTSGFGSVRQFNRDMRMVFRASPVELRRRRRRADRLAADGGLRVRLPFTPPLNWPALVRFLAERAVPGVESLREGVYRRTISLDGEAGLLEVQPGGLDHLLLRAHLPFWEGLIHVVERAGRIFGINVDTSPAEAVLAGDPLIGPLIAAAPGLRAPGAWGAFEIAVDAVLSQYGERAAVREQMAALIAATGPPVPGLGHGLTRLFPSAESLATADLTAAGLPTAAVRTLHALAAAVAADDTLLDGAALHSGLVTSLIGISGITESTAQLIALRLGYDDAFPFDEQAIRTGLRRLVPPDTGDDVLAAAQSWRPWRSFAATHLLLAT